MAFGSVGVVYGDIGTSPLYALRESLFHASAHGTVGERDVIGVVSLLIWALFLIVTVKYVIFVMRADNKGEGGTLALMALAQKVIGRRSGYIFVLGIVGAALFTGDAIITPAISVLSAVEGLKLVTPHLDHYVTLIALVILITLFLVQSKGTAGIARWFSPIMTVWFVCIAVLGLMHIGDAPRVLQAFNPINALSFLFSHGVISFVVMGSVFLAVTGAEALYADMGHFGRKPIQAAWISFVFPALILNYLGQGALILDNPKAIENPFFLLAPEWALLPLVVLATAATVIASQATITGAFSLARQAIQLGLLPRLEIQHTSDTQEGQIYIPRVNRILLIGVVLLVLIFRTSSALASAYGIAVTASMVVDSCLVFFVAWHLWRWPLAGALLFASLFLTVELAFFASNILKLMDGGYVPVLIGGLMILIMWTWLRGTHFLESKTRRDAIPTRDLIRMLENSKPIRVPGTAIFLTQDADSAPSALMHNLKHNKVLHERVFLVSVQTENVPRVPREYRYEIEKLSDDFTKIRLRYGFMESPRVPAAMALMRKSGLKFDIMTTSFFLGRRTLKESPTSGMPVWQDRLFIALSKHSANATDFFSIPSDRVVELGAQVKI
ncbi:MULTISPECIES: potassium transporter Kup [unclassified Beijerinckia]|uniref:potassium transporter Kup n=1 Tax=unclassified Beijerinckia TaxID=2638183 RepID=UPI000898F72A|nr:MULTISPECIES: potassium transporter Kup [unclassified Beijerinckia]MDH7797283.1 KUP system potassium uptake protein [Beijerinckia sp. GAS462]SEC79342.1 KUP system potassium uptake protein [Beijerinckia sp. 28-YEA-48]